ncbi:MAG: hypothetical protein GY880_26130 [Planctomycetaceae bacterium]|nr:hypothetical protein [Planctomycetaceae bacterium]
MTKEITLKEALKLVEFDFVHGSWGVKDVKGNVFGDVFGNVDGTIDGKEWQFVETPKDKLKRLIEESGNEELLETFNQLENNS